MGPGALQKVGGAVDLSQKKQAKKPAYFVGWQQTRLCAAHHTAALFPPATPGCGSGMRSVLGTACSVSLHIQQV